MALHKKWIFPLRISSVNVTKSAVSLPMKILSIIAIFHFRWFFSSSFIMNTSLMLIFTVFSLWLRLWLSLSPALKAAKYSWTHLFHLFCSGESSGNLKSLPRILKLGVNTEHVKSSSIYVNGRLFRLTSTFNNTSSNSDHVNNDFPMDLYRLCFVSSIKRSYYPTHHGPLERLKFQIILSLLTKSCNLHLY